MIVNSFFQLLSRVNPFKTDRWIILGVGWRGCVLLVWSEVMVLSAELKTTLSYERRIFAHPLITHSFPSLHVQYMCAASHHVQLR